MELLPRPAASPRVLKLSVIVPLTFVVLASAPRPSGGIPSETGAGQARFSAAVDLVEVYATVTGADGEPATLLPRDAFEVYEDGVRQTVTTFAAGSFPLSVAIALDRSFSMAKGRLALAKAAADAFLDDLRPSDRALILAIGSDVEMLAPLSADSAALKTAVDGLQPWGTTPLYDALVEGIDRIQPASGRRALILLSDGDDRYSHTTPEEALDHARHSDVIVYPVVIGKTRPPLFAELAALTGGHSFQVNDDRAIRNTFLAIGRELRGQYLLGYTPTRPVLAGSAEWRSIRVVVRKPGARVRARDGYWVK